MAALRPLNLLEILTLLLVIFFTLLSALPTSTNLTAVSKTGTKTASKPELIDNYNCPTDCICILSESPKTQHLHAKCSSTAGLKTPEQKTATLPIHSIDLSYLNLKRLAHALDKLTDLTTINLAHNELHEIGHLGRHIKKLNLKNNRFTSAKLIKLPHHLEELNLQHNDITYLPKELMHLKYLRQLELSHNPINCSCDTLDVRNWLQENRVYMEHPVVCTYPNDMYGKSWLQVKQSDICAKEIHGWYVPNAEENELMMGDQPIEGSGDRDNEDEDELGRAYLPVGDRKSANSDDKDVNDDVEGSGDLSIMNLPLNLVDQTTQGPAELRMQTVNTSTETSVRSEEDEGDESSGSGGGLLVIPNIANETFITDDFDAPDTNDTYDHDDDFDTKLVEAPSPDIFRENMGIFEGNEENQPVSEEAIVPVVHKNLNANNLSDVITDAPNADNRSIDAQESEAILTANMQKKDDSNATYFLLGVIGLIIVGLILFVAINRCQHSGNAARESDAQRQTELLDMDKKNLGKPLQRNGNEHIPLINEKVKLNEATPVNGTSKKPYDVNDVKDAVGQQPLLNRNGKELHDNLPTINEPVNEQSPHKYYPITPRYPTPQSPRASKYSQQVQTEQNNNEPDAKYPPSSPKSGRYSPVYSPETGRVKIKLTETPKPKTPMLVTRSKSNAGDIITTPVHQVPAVGGAAGGINNYVNH